MSWIDNTPQVHSADAYGAIITVQRHLRGVARNGKTVWQEPADAPEGLGAVCIQRCPNAAVSGDLDSFTADPAPRLYGDAVLPDGWADPTSGSNVILAVDDDTGLRLVSDSRGKSHLEALWRDGISTMSFPSGEAGWQQLSPNRQSGSIVSLGATEGDGPPSLMVARLGDKGWRVSSGGNQRACVSPDGEWSVVGNALSTGSKKLQLDAALAGEHCQFTRDTVVFGGFGAPEESTLTVVGLDGSTKWKHSLPANAWVSASSVDNRIAISNITPNAQSVQVLDSSGEEVKRYPGACSAMFVATGELVVVDTAGNSRWEPE